MCAPLWAQGATSLVSPGYDLYYTPPDGVFSHQTFGDIPIQGDPVGPGNADIVIERLDAFSLGVGDPARVIEARMVKFAMRSTTPVSIAGQTYDVAIVSTPSPTGTMLVDKTNIDGGSQAYALPVNFEVTFTNTDDATDTFVEVYADEFAPTGQWSHTPSPKDAHAGIYVSGGYYGGVTPGTGGMPMNPPMEEITALWSHKHLTAVLLTSAPAMSPFGIVMMVILLVLGGVRALRVAPREPSEATLG